MKICKDVAIYDMHNVLIIEGKSLLVNFGRMYDVLIERKKLLVIFARIKKNFAQECITY